MGKPMGNGMPLAAVVTTSAIAETSAQCEYFNTFGGNPVSTAVGLEVLSVIKDEQLMENAYHVGAHALQALAGLMPRHAPIGDVRGEGLMLGVEFVTDRARRTPDPEAAAHVMGHMRAHGVLVSTDGPFASVIKMKPPMCVTVADMDAMVAALDAALTDYARTALRVSNGSARHPHAPTAATASGASASASRALPALEQLLARSKVADPAGGPHHASMPRAPATPASSAGTAVTSMLQRHQK